MKNKLFCLCVSALCCLPVLAYAQASWKLDGNSGTTPGTQFLGTTDTNALELKVNNARVLRLEPGFSPNLIGGHSDNFVPLGIAGVTISGGGQGGSPNQATNDFATIGGGFGNLAGAWTSTIGGGSENSIQFESTFSTIGGGSGNRIQTSAQYATVAGGLFNLVGDNSSGANITGGYNNSARAIYSSIGGGSGNSIEIEARSSVIAGGASSTIESNATFSTISGGVGNRIGPNLYSSVIAGGQNCSIESGSWFSMISGGEDNHIGRSSLASVIGGGSRNAVRSNSWWSVICGGQNCTIESYSVVSTISGGYLNSIGPNTEYSFIGGGLLNTNEGVGAMIGGGQFNYAYGRVSVIGGGSGNTTNGLGACVPGGINNSALDYLSFAAGHRAKGLHQGAFVWADSTEEDFASTGANQFLIRASGGVGIGKTSPQAQLDVEGNAAISGNVGIGTTSPQAKLDVAGKIRCEVLELTSDRNAKANVRPLNLPQVLEKIGGLEVSEWDYTNAPGIRHCGAMAQDFHRAFGLGSDDKHINPLDVASVALAGVQALARELRQRDEQLAEKDARIAALESRLNKTEQQLATNTALIENLVAQFSATNKSDTSASTMSKLSTFNLPNP